MLITQNYHDKIVGQKQKELLDTSNKLIRAKKELEAQREVVAANDVTIARLSERVSRLDERYSKERDRHNEVRVELAEARAELECLHERVAWWKKQAEATIPFAGDGHNMTRLAAKMEVGDFDDDGDDPPPEMVSADGLMSRINEIYGDGLTLDEILARQAAYADRNNT